MVSLTYFFSVVRTCYNDWIFPLLSAPFPVFGSYMMFFLVSLLFLFVGVLIKILVSTDSR